MTAIPNIRLFDGARDLVMRNEMMLYGVIDPTGGDSIRAIDVVSSLANVTGDTVSVRINSPGGSVNEAIAIYNALRADGRRIIVRVDAIAASSASLVAMAGDEIVMAENASMMIHDPWAAAAGGAATFRAIADEIDRMRAIVVDLYAKRTKRSADEISQLMSAETFMGAEEAVRLGFADRIEQAFAVAACATLSHDALARLLLKEMKMADNPAIDVQAALKAERRRIGEIQASLMAAKLPVDDDFANGLVNSSMSAEAAKAKILDAFVEKNRAEGNDLEIRPSNIDVGMSYDSPDYRCSAATDALYARLAGTQPAPHARAFMSMSLQDMSRTLGAPTGWLAGGGVRNAGPQTISDFPSALGTAMGRVLIDQMRAFDTGASQIAKMVPASDFRQQTAVSVGAFPELLPVEEGAEITYGYIGDNGEKYAIKSFARAISISFQALVNDDLSAVQMAIRNIAFAANELKAATIVNALNATMSDGAAVFHASHNNLATGGPSALSVTSLSTARAGIRSQKLLGASSPLGITPAILFVPIGLETTAEQLVASITATKAADVNPFAERLRVAVEPRLSSATGWYLFADPMMYETVRLATLNGTPGPVLEMNNEFNVLGSTWRAHWHLGAAPVDFRGAYKSTGV